MKLNLRLILSLIPLGILMMLLPGCYTQLATTRDNDRDENRNYNSDNNSNDENAEGNYRDDDTSQYVNSYDDDSYHQRYGFSYYYPSYRSMWPSYYFSAAYADPWYYGMYGVYDPYYYGYSNPYYFTGYYSPYYSSYYYPGVYASGYGYRTSVHNNTKRSFGSQRGGTSRGTQPVDGSMSPPPQRDRGTGGVGTLPTGGLIDRTGSGSARGGKPVEVGSTPRREVGSRGVLRGLPNRDVRGGGSRGSITHGSGHRDTVPVIPRLEGKSTPPPATSRGSYRAPPQGGRESSAPRSSTPPASGSSGRTSGSKRGSRP